METKDTPQTREQIITAALEGREQEVMSTWSWYSRSCLACI
jgi:hypothetical protein